MNTDTELLIKTKQLLLEATEEIQNVYGKDTELTIKIIKLMVKIDYRLIDDKI